MHSLISLRQQPRTGSGLGAAARQRRRGSGRLFLTLGLLAGVLPLGAATHIVTNTSDSGPGSLRQAIAQASAGDTIQFSLPNPSTITLTSGELLLDKNLTITGPGAAQLAVSGNQPSRLFEIGAGATVTLSGLTMENGYDTSDYGGGGLLNHGTLTLINSTVAGNSVDSAVGNENSDGGGLYNDGTLTLTNSTITGNSAAEGGGLYNDGPLTLTNSTIAGNTATYGGGLFNSSGDAGNQGALTLKSTLLAGNGSGGNCYFDSRSGGTNTSQGYNLSDDNTCAFFFTTPGDENQVVAGVGLDPQGLQNNGGPTQTIALLPTSPAVDHIPSAQCTDIQGHPVTTDQRGLARPQGVGCDVGAFELVHATQTVTNTNDNGPGSLRQAIAQASAGDTIQFAPGLSGTLTLTSGELLLDKNLTITGPGAGQLAVSGNHTSRVFEISTGVTVVLSELTVENGYDNTSGGGGLLNDGTLTLTNSTIAGNSASFNGGGLYNDGALTLTNSTIANNSARNAGGGLYNEGPLLLTNSTIASNSAVHSGGGLFNYGALTVKSTLLAGNGSGGNCFLNGGTNTSQGYNVSDDNSCSSAFTAPGDENQVVAGAGLDPQGLQNNGGPTQTIALLPTSPAVDHIPVAACTDSNHQPVTTDQRGISRPQGPGCDSGAYELVKSVPFSRFQADLVISTGKLPGFALTAFFTLGSNSSGLSPATEAMTLQIASYTLTLPAGSFQPLWNGTNAPYAYEGTVNGGKLVLDLLPLGNNQWQFAAAGAPVAFPGLRNPVSVSLTFGHDTGTTTTTALLLTN